jgi:hypothetical protein
MTSSLTVIGKEVVVEYNSTYSAHDCFVKSVMAFVFGWLLNCKINVNCNELKLGTPATSPGGGGKDNGVQLYLDVCIGIHGIS